MFVINLNMKLQTKTADIFSHYEVIRAFMEKISFESTDFKLQTFRRSLISAKS
jgi:hypothetical protein